jgi:hypothetical protein
LTSIGDGGIASAFSRLRGLPRHGANAADDLDIETYFSAFIQGPDLPWSGSRDHGR